MTDPDELRGAIAGVRSGIESACERSGRNPGEVLLVAVTKTVPVEAIQAARAEGIHDFAENYANELVAKAAEVEATWHFIGKLQRGTAHHVAEHADVVHSAQPGHALDRLAARAVANKRFLRCLLQVDFTGRRQGVAPEEAADAVAACRSLHGVRLVGLMTLPPWTGDSEATRPYFARLRALRDRIRQDHPEVTELSMGMSGDYEVAVEEGATMVRVGTALFGPRPEQSMPGDAPLGGER
ncbi:MAG TPA: YggS family pyridoxal phosphate-dependent enzyme [Actinomycetota bacterium]